MKHRWLPWQRLCIPIYESDISDPIFARHLCLPPAGRGHSVVGGRSSSKNGEYYPAQQLCIGLAILTRPATYVVSVNKLTRLCSCYFENDQCGWSFSNAIIRHRFKSMNIPVTTYEVTKVIVCRGDTNVSWYMSTCNISSKNDVPASNVSSRLFLLKVVFFFGGGGYTFFVTSMLHACTVERAQVSHNVLHFSHFFGSKAWYKNHLGLRNIMCVVAIACSDFIDPQGFVVAFLIN